MRGRPWPLVWPMLARARLGWAWAKMRWPLLAHLSPVTAHRPLPGLRPPISPIFPGDATQCNEMQHFSAFLSFGCLLPAQRGPDRYSRQPSHMIPDRCKYTYVYILVKGREKFFPAGRSLLPGKTIVRRSSESCGVLRVAQGTVVLSGRKDLLRGLIV